jgi:histidyl-tRNA synthetase
MSETPQPVRGMNDVLPDDTAAWQWLERVARETFAEYGYREIRLPLLERTELFKRSIGEMTDIVEKEMYTFDDRGGDSLTLRPEATAGIVRACITNGLLHNQRQKVWCMGPMFRYERPQKGRYRQFHQIDVEALGYPGPDVDAELIMMSARLWRRLSLTGLRLNLNSLGTPESRKGYRAELVEYFRRHEGVLDEDSKRRLGGNPLRILDTKNPAMRDVVAGAPVITDYLDAESAAHFAALRARLDAVGIEYAVNPRLVRGLDYYSRTVFEWITSDLGSQDAVCSGGRYDGLVEQLGGAPAPAIGWALGQERIVELMRLQGRAGNEASPHVYLALAGGAAEAAGLQLAEALRDAVPGLRIETHCGGGSFKSQLKRADRSGASHALILGDDEVARQVATLKPLREESGQRQVPLAALAPELAPLVRAR